MINEEAQDLLFNNARTANGWLAGDVTDTQLKQLFDLMKMAPTSANCQPARLVFLRSAEAKERLRPALSPGNLDKTLKAPIVTIIAHDTQFQEHLPRVFPTAKRTAPLVNWPRSVTAPCKAATSFWRPGR